jgi:hypothetical protein
LGSTYCHLCLPPANLKGTPYLNRDFILLVPRTLHTSRTSTADHPIMWDFHSQTEAIIQWHGTARLDKATHLRSGPSPRIAVKSAIDATSTLSRIPILITISLCGKDEGATNAVIQNAKTAAVASTIDTQSIAIRHFGAELFPRLNRLTQVHRSRAGLPYTRTISTAIMIAFTRDSLFRPMVGAKSREVRHLLSECGPEPFPFDWAPRRVSLGLPVSNCLGEI